MCAEVVEFKVCELNDALGKALVVSRRQRWYLYDDVLSHEYQALKKVMKHANEYVTQNDNDI